MKSKRALLLTLLIATLVGPGANASPITLAGDPIGAGQLVFSDFTIAPAGMIPTQNSTPGNGTGQAGASIDNTAATAYINYGAANTGYIVTPAVGLSNVTGLTLTTASDFPNGDPLSFSLYGSNTQTANSTADTVFSLSDFTEIATDQDTGLLAQTGRGFTVPVAFANVENYTTYLLVFPTVRNANAASLKIAEAILTGTIIPAQGVPLVIKSHSFNFVTNQLTLTWGSMSNKTYRITTSSTLAAPWTNVVTGIPGAPMLTETSATVNFVRGNRGFFRVETE